MLAGAALCLLLLLPVPAPSEPAPAAAPAPVRGQIIMLTGELVVVKSADGTSILIPLAPTTKIDSALKPGDHVEVVVTPDRQLGSIRKIAP